MLLAVDIGNTNIKLALFKGKQILYSWRIATDKNACLKEYRRRLARLFAQKKVNARHHIEGIIICSVVPKLTKMLKKVLFSLFKKRALIMGEDVIAPVKNLYKKPTQVGQDRLVNALSAFNKYGGPAIIVDFGTALTFDLVSAKGCYVGGVIVPGMETSLEALSERADLLPKIRLSRPQALLGRETVASMESGIVYGYSFLVEGMLRRLKKSFGASAQIVATGGTASLMARYSPSLKKIDHNLTLQGLRLIYERRKQDGLLKKQ